MIRALALSKVIALLATIANASPCFERDHIAAFLIHEQGMTLRGWGIDATGNMLELFTAYNGRFAVLTTSANKCASLIWAEHHGGRLVDPPRRNMAVPPANRLDRGEPT